MLVAVVAGLVMIGGCGGSGSRHRVRHAALTPSGPDARSGSPGSRGSPGSPGSRGSPGSPGSPGASATRRRATRPHAGTSPTAGSAASATSTAATVTVSAGGTGTARAGAGSVPAARVTFAAPGGESPTTFVASADAICRSFRARAHAIGAGATTLVSRETELGHLLSATEQSVKALTGLSPPVVDAAGLRRFAAMTVASVIAFSEAQKRTSSTSEAAGSQVEAKDMADSAQSSTDAIAAQAAARKLGLHVCGSPGSAWL